MSIFTNSTICVISGQLLEYFLLPYIPSNFWLDADIVYFTMLGPRYFCIAKNIL